MKSVARAERALRRAVRVRGQLVERKAPRERIGRASRLVTRSLRELIAAERAE